MASSAQVTKEIYTCLGKTLSVVFDWSWNSFDCPLSDFFLIFLLKSLIFTSCFYSWTPLLLLHWFSYPPSQHGKWLWCIHQRQHEITEEGILSYLSRQIKKDFRVSGRNWTQDLRNAGEMFWRLSYKNSCGQPSCLTEFFFTQSMGFVGLIPTRNSETFSVIPSPIAKQPSLFYIIHPWVYSKPFHLLYIL